MRLIDADAVKDAIAELNENGYDISPSDLAFVRNILLRMPTIEPKKGKWETKPFSDTNDPMMDTGAVWCRCSECKTKLGVFKDGNFFDYCPNCGAKMDGDVKDGE